MFVMCGFFVGFYVAKDDCISRIVLTLLVILTLSLFAVSPCLAQEGGGIQSEDLQAQLIELQKDFETDLAELKELENSANSSKTEFTGNRKEMSRVRSQVADAKKIVAQKRSEINSIKRQIAALGREKNMKELQRLAQKKNIDRQTLAASLTSTSLLTAGQQQASVQQKQKTTTKRSTVDALPILVSPESANSSGVESALAQNISAMGQALGADSALDEDKQQGAAAVLGGYAVDTAVSAGTAAAEEFLGSFGKAKIDLSLGESLQVESFGIDYLLPIIENERTLGFTQVGYWDSNGSSTLNVGIGIRRFGGSSMWGANLFLDSDLTHGHKRGSLGLEGMIRFLKGYSNLYVPLSDWIDVNDPTRSLEAKVASGVDVGLEVYVPWVTGLSLSAEYSQWFGEDVDLSGAFSDSSAGDNTSGLSDNPSEVSITVEYRPIPLLGVSYERTIDDEGGDRQIGIDLSWDFDLTLSEQLRPASKGSVGTVESMRREFVTREKDILLQYREDQDTQRGVGNVLNAGDDQIKGYVYGGKFTQSATGTDGGKLTYTSDDPLIATVSNSGEVTMLNIGQTVIRVHEAATEVTSAETDEYILTISISHSGLFWDDQNGEIDNRGVVTKPAKSGPFQIKAITNLDGSDGAIDYAIIGNSAVASIDPTDGTVTPGDAGSVMVRASQSESSDGNYRPTQIDYILHVGKSGASVLGWQSGDVDGHVKPAEYAKPVTGDVAVPSAQVTGRIVYSTDRPDLLAVDPDTGDLKIYGVGQAVVTARLVNDPNFQHVTISYTLDIAKSNPIAAGVAYWSRGLANGAQVDANPFHAPPVTTASLIKGVTIGYTSGTRSVADVDPVKGTLTIHQDGQSVITATYPETANFTAADLTYVLNAESLSNLSWDQVDPAQGSFQIQLSDDVTVTASATDGTGTVEYDSYDKKVADIEKQGGKIIPKGLGKTKLFALQKADGTYVDTTIETEVEITTGTPTLTWNDKSVESSKWVTKKYDNDGFEYQVQASANSGGKITYRSTSNAVDVGLDTGLVKFKDASTVARIEATAAATSDYFSGKTFYDLELLPGTGDPLHCRQAKIYIDSYGKDDMSQNIYGGSGHLGLQRVYSSTHSCAYIQGHLFEVAGLCFGMYIWITVQDVGNSKYETVETGYHYVVNTN